MHSSNEIQAWLYKSHERSLPRKQQSDLGRRLLQTALRHEGISLPDSMLEVPALTLFEFIRKNHGLETSISHCPALTGVALPGEPG